MDGYTEYGYRGLEELKQKEKEIEKLKEEISELKNAITKLWKICNDLQAKVSILLLTDYKNEHI